MTNRLLSLLVISAMAIQSALAQAAKPFVSSMFSDNMVLQRGVKAPVWGWTTPGAKIKVSIAGKSASTTADSEGRWVVKLPSLKAGGPYTLDIDGPQKVSLQNVLIGDVWICSGQSNMEQGIGASRDPEKEIAAANYPNIRLFSVAKNPSFSLVENTQGSWTVCNPQNVSAGGWAGFSAVGYYFGRTLHSELNVPIGLIHSSWGGTIAEAWVSAGSLKKEMPDFVAAVDQVEATANVSQSADFAKTVADWYAKNDVGSGKGWGSPSFDASAWKSMNLPTLWENAGLPDFDGIVWFRKEIVLTADQAKSARLHLGPIDDNDVTWINGVQVGQTDGYNLDRIYTVPSGVLKAGVNVIAVRVLDTAGGGGIYGQPQQMALELESGKALPLSGPWKYAVSKDLKEATPYPIQMNNNPNIVTVLYNGMIAPVAPYGIKGAIWYQGESNAGRDEQYARLLPTLIHDWRQSFGVGEFPFYIVQLANFMQQDSEPKNDPWPRLREAQYITTKKVKNTGISNTIDIGEADDIHPKNKQDVGRRLALNALALTYGKKIVYSGPVYKSMKVEGDKARISFDFVGGGLVAKGGDLKGFAVAGEDGKFYWANATIEGDTVVVSAPQVSKPKTVHYAWGNNPVCNLYNQADLPAFSFRTDGPLSQKSKPNAAKK
ncbi:MAG: sialate O-acetylesterase [Fimbriimonas sp.]